MEYEYDRESRAEPNPKPKGKASRGTSLGLCAANVATVVLMLLNMVFLVAGGMFIYFAMQFKNSGWQDVFTDDLAWIGTMAHTVILTIGIVVLVVASTGCLGAVSRNRLLLAIYGIVLIITALVFVGAAIAAAVGKSKMTAWEAASYPAIAKEKDVAAGFDKLYCMAQVTYYCSDAQAVEVATLFGLSVPTSVLSAMTVTAACAQSAVSSLSGMTELCTLCNTVSSYSRFNVVATWTDANCPRSTANQAWCGTMLLNKGTSDDASSSAPYKPCRSPFLEMLAKWCQNLMMVTIIVTLLLLAVLGFTVLVRAGSRRPPLEESFIVDTPSPY